MKLKLMLSSTILLAIMPLVACSSNSKIVVDDKEEKKDDKDDEREKVDHNFLTEVVDETWDDIDVNVETFDEWLQVKAMYEQAIVDLNEQNQHLSSSNEDMQVYYKNLFYIAWYLRIIGKANQNISWLKFESFYSDILYNDSKEVNFIYALYVQNRRMQFLSWDTFQKLQNFYYQNVVKHQQGDLLANDLTIPYNYLNLTRKTITHEEITIFYNNYVSEANKANIDKVLQYFSQKKDYVQWQESINNNNDALAKRWQDRIWTRHPFITDNTYLDWLITKPPFKPFSSDFSFNQMTWEEWIVS